MSAGKKTFGAWANATLRKIFGRPLTLTLIRHAYVTNISIEHMPKEERDAVGVLMGHSRSTQEIYRFRFGKTNDKSTWYCVQPKSGDEEGKDDTSSVKGGKE